MIDEQVSAIIFDFGGVIINIDYEATINSFKNLGIENFDELYSQAAQTDLFDNIETGRISPQHFINGLLKILPAGITPNQVVYAWNSIILDIPKERVEFLNHLHSTHKIYLLSNTNAIHIEKALRIWNQTFQTSIYDTFDHVYFSHEIGLRKPHREIFEYVCKEQHLVPRNTLFIDDSIQHIEGASLVGLKTLHLLPGQEIQDVLS